MIKRLLYIALWCNFSLLAWSQEGERYLNFNQYIEIVKENHPIALRAKLNPEFGEAAVRAARGGFDPQVFTNIGQKYFQNDQYYSLVDAGLKVPTWFGLDVYGGFEQNNGVNLNPERKTPSNGLVYAGVSLPVGQGLFIDQRRADLRQAQLFEKISEEEQRLMINELLLKASNAYWDWFAAYENVRIFEEAVRVAEERFEGVRMSALMGDVSIIDTVEAIIQVETREVRRQQAVLRFKNATQQLSVFLWQDGTVPLEIDDNVLPSDNQVLTDYILDAEIEGEIDSLINIHPAIIQNRYYLDQLEIERRWKAEQLKPVLNLKYNALNEPLNDNVIAGYSLNNYNWGLQFYMPIFLRRERGELAITKLKIRDANLDLENQFAEFMANTNMAINNWKTSTQQLELYRSTVNNMETLLNGERTRFEVGESSLFLVNAREESFINGQVELIRLITKNQKSLIDISYQLGVLGD